MSLDSATFSEGVWKAGTIPQNFTAGETIYEGQIVTIDSNGYIVGATESSIPIGVAIQPASSGNAVGVAIKGSIVYIHADGTGITAGHLVGATTVGTINGYGKDLGTTAPSGLTAHPIGIAIDTISANSVGKILII